MDADKISRASAVTPLFEAGKVFFPSSAAWLTDYLDELAMFPAGAHDDMVDSTTQALNHLRGSSYVYGVNEYVQQLAADAEQPNAKSPDPTSCPECGRTVVQKLSSGFRCAQYGTQWGDKPAVARFSRRDLLHKGVFAFRR